MLLLTPELDSILNIQFFLFCSFYGECVWLFLMLALLRRTSLWPPSILPVSSRYATNWAILAWMVCCDLCSIDSFKEGTISILLYFKIESNEMSYSKETNPCCVFRPVNRCFKCCSLVKMNFLSVFTSFSLTNRKGRKRMRKRWIIHKNGCTRVLVLLLKTGRHTKAGPLLRKLWFFLIISFCNCHSIKYTELSEL